MKKHIPTLFKTKHLATAFIIFFGVTHSINAATWTDVYYELGVNNSVSGNAYIAPAHITDNLGQAVSTTQTLFGEANVSAYAAPGVLRTGVSNFADVQSIAGTGVSDISFSTTQASFFDHITINPANTALLGQTGTVNGYLLLSGNNEALWNVTDNNSVYFNVSSSIMLQIFGTGVSGFVQAREIQGNSGGSITSIVDPVPSIIPVSFSTTFGSKTGIQYNMNLQGNASASFGFRECDGGIYPCGASASAALTADYMNSLIWGGISSITDASGNVIEFTLSSDSGFNYVSAVPVPAAVWLFSSGLLWLITIAKRKYV